MSPGHRLRIILGISVLLVAALATSGCHTGRGPLPGPPDPPPAAAGLKVIVLGSAQDAGIPQLGCRCLHCRVALQSRGERRQVASLGVINPSTGETLLIDATPDVRDQVGLLQNDSLVSLHGMRKPVDAIALTHAHMGHYAGLLHFGKEAASTEQIPVFATPRMLDHLLANRPFADLFDSGFLEARPITPGEAFEPIAGVRLTPLLVPHREELSDAVGYLIEGSSRRLLYVPDIDAWDRWDRSLPELLGEVDYAILDGTFYSKGELPDRDLSDIPHPLIGTTMDLLRGSELRSEVWFTHLNHSNPVHRAGSTERKEVEAAGFFVAEDGVFFWL